MGIEEEHLKQIQEDIQVRLKERDETRERNITKKMQEFEKKYDFVNGQLLKSIAQVSELLNPDNTASAGRVKSADKMIIMPGLFDGKNLKRKNNIMKNSANICHFKLRVVT